MNDPIDGDGSISLKELKRLFKSLGEKPSETKLKAMIKDADEDRDGTISFTEFLNLMVKNCEDGGRVCLILQRDYEKCIEPQGCHRGSYLGGMGSIWAS